MDRVYSHRMHRDGLHDKKYEKRKSPPGLEFLAEDDIDAGVWIRMVFALAKDVQYINIFNTNTMIIRM